MSQVWNVGTLGCRNNITKQANKVDVKGSRSVM